jgi:hypothetical protein
MPPSAVTMLKKRVRFKQNSPLPQGSLSLRQLIEAWSGHSVHFVSEGLLILGWVAMWRPVEIFLYDWWPEFGKRRLFDRIAGLQIETRAASENDQVLYRGATLRERDMNIAIGVCGDLCHQDIPQ